MRAGGQRRGRLEALDAGEELVSRLARRAALRELRRVVRALDRAEVGAAVVEQALRLVAEGCVRHLVAKAAEAAHGLGGGGRVGGPAQE